MSAVESSRSPGGRLGKRLDFETLITDISASLFAAAPGALEAAVERGLDQVRRFFEADRCALLSVRADLAFASVRLASYGEGVPHADAEANLVAAFPWAAQQLLGARVPIRVPRLADLPAEAAIDRESWAQMPITSALALPIETVGVVGHLIVLQTARAEREWPESFVPRLRVLGELLVSALNRQALVDELQMSEARLASAAELAGLALYEGDYVQGTMYVDPRLRELCGMPDALQGLELAEFLLEHIHPEDRPGFRDLRERLHQGLCERASAEYRYLHPSHRELWIQHEARVARRASNGRAIVTYGVLRDITAQKRVEQGLRNLSQRLIQAHEEERALLARELHDDVTQRLAVLAIDLGRAELSAADRDEAGVLRSAREGVVRISEDVHALAYQLHPSVLRELGLIEALRIECERRGRQGQVDLSLDLGTLPDGLGKDEALCLFRIAQEALSNVARHSRARTAAVRLRRMAGGVQLAVHDDGVGFDVEHPGRSRSLGLASMRERAHLVNGTLDVDTSPGQGTSVVAWVPLDGARR